MEAASQRLGPEKSLPYKDDFSSSEEYVDALLDFSSTNELLQNLCGGVHLLDFFTSTPDLYSRILPQEWRAFCREHEIMSFLDLLLREDLDAFTSTDESAQQWRDGPLPPSSLLSYIRSVRQHLLLRVPYKSQCSRNRAMKPVQKLSRRVAVGMNVKKVHEVGLFASYVSDLTSSISSSSSSGGEVSHLVDFGSGQNYLGRALASEPYGKNVVAIESRGHNQDQAIKFDVMAKLRAKEVVYRNKKDFRGGTDAAEAVEEVPAPLPDPEVSAEHGCEDDECAEPKAKVQISAEGRGTVQYVEHWISDGDLTPVIDQIVDPSSAKTHTTAEPTETTGFNTTSIPLSTTANASKNLTIISLHSCGNLVHHGLRSLTANPSVRAVALIGCCYNLITERLQTPTYKLPSLRASAHPRVEREGMRGDPAGFPMSERMCNHTHPASGEKGVNLNITARMMAVQAPWNWGQKDSDGFFTRHFYRALLQRILLDKGVVNPPSHDHEGGSPLGHSSGTPIIIGSLRKSCYTSFVAYVRGALAKLVLDPERGSLFEAKVASMSDEEIEEYAELYRERKKELSVIWSLMAFSAGVVEALVVTDRWLWLKEQDEVGEAWVEPVFDVAISPRNLVVVGIKK